MGDRSNIFIQQEMGDDGQYVGIGVYAHSHGALLHDEAIALIPKASVRLGDTSYFARILIQNLLRGFASPDRDTGAGLWVSHPDDNEHPILVINAHTGEHWFCDEQSYRKDKA